eukprot:1136316-Pelagomonas_calceolata.AAC.2
MANCVQQAMVPSTSYSSLRPLPTATSRLPSTRRGVCAHAAAPADTGLSCAALNRGGLAEVAPGPSLLACMHPSAVQIKRRSKFRRTWRQCASSLSSTPSGEGLGRLGP